MPGTTCYGATVQNKLVLFTSPQGSHQHRSLHEGLYNDVDKPTIKSIRFRWSVHNISKSYRSIPAKKKRAYQGVEGKTRFDIRCDMFKVRYRKFDTASSMYPNIRYRYGGQKPFDISILRKSDVSKHFDTGKRGQNVFDVAIYGKFDIASSTNPNIRYRMVGKTRSIFRYIASSMYPNIRYREMRAKRVRSFDISKV